MKMSRLTIISLCLLAIVSCNRHVPADDTFQVDCTMHVGTLACDSATLMIFDEDYGQMRVMGMSSLSDSLFSFAGHIDRPAVAMIQFHTDSLPASFYFVLEPTHIAIDIERDRWLIRGGKANDAYQLFLNRHDRLRAQRDSLWRKYLKMGVIDSTLTWQAERELLKADSTLQDSLQHITTERINQGDLAGRLIKQRLMPTLTRQSLDQLNE